MSAPPRSGEPPLRRPLLAAAFVFVLGTSMTLGLHAATLDGTSGPGGFLSPSAEPRRWLVDGRAASRVERDIQVDGRAVTAAAARPGGGWVLACSDGTILTVTDAGTADRSMEGPRNARTMVRLGAADRYAVPGSGGTLAMVEPAPGRVLFAGGQTGWLWAAAASADGSRILTASREGTLALRDGEGAVLRLLSGHRGPVRDVAFSPDGGAALSLGSDGLVRTWTREGRPLGTIDAGGGGAHRACFTGDGSMVLVVPADGRPPTVHGLDALSMATLAGAGTVVAASPSPSGVVTGTSDGQVVEWDLGGDGSSAVAATPFPRARHRGTVGALAWLGGAEGWLASAAGDGALRLSVRDAGERAVLLGMARHSSSIVPAEDGRSLLVLFKSDQRVPVLRVDLGNLPRSR